MLSAKLKRNGAKPKSEPQPEVQLDAEPAGVVEQPWFDDVMKILKLGKPPLLMLVGEPGIGKTTLARHAARLLTGQEALTLSGSPEIEQTHLWGRWGLAGGETRWLDGPLALALRAGRVLIIDEFSQIPLECRSALLPLRDQSEIHNPLNGECLKIPPTFRLIATSNPETLTCRKNAGIAKVLFDGFYIFSCPDLSDFQVAELLRHHFPKEEHRIPRALELFNEYRDFTSKGSSGRSHLSYRAAEHLMRLLPLMPERRAVELALVSKFLPADKDLFDAAQLKLSISNNRDEEPGEAE